MLEIKQLTRLQIIKYCEKLEEENKLLKQCLDEMMFKADVINITIHGELGDYAYVRSDKQLKLNVKE